MPILVDFNFIQQTDARLSPPSYIHYPREDYFKPDVADVKEPQFFISFLPADTGADNILLDSVGIGQNFGLYRWPASVSNDGWQLNFFVSLLSQFNLDASSDDLLNSDYLVGFRFGNFTGRFRFFHQSSHIGDELLLSGNAAERIT